MKKTAPLFIILIFLVSCTSKRTVPDNILSPKEMKAVMWDVMRADELAEINSYKDSTYRTIAKHQGLYQSIFDLHHTTKAAFRNSVTFYQNHPDILKTVIDSIQRQLDSSRQKKQDTISIKSKAPL